MVRILRGALIAVALGAAFAGGFLVKSLAERSPQVVVADRPAPSRTAGSFTTTDTVRTPPVTAKTTTARPTIDQVRVDPPRLPVPETPIIQSPTASAPEMPTAVDPNDPGFQLIKKELGIKTTILDRSEPLPAVLTSAKKDNRSVVTPPPMPAIGPVPRLDIPSMEPHPAGPAVAPGPVRLVNLRSIELDFEITRTGLSKVRAVELWVTRDQGRTWTMMDRMAGMQTPFRARLGSEGLYGFRTVFESESGMRSPEPRSGQSPDVQLKLDTTPPEVVMLPPESVPGQPGMVRLRWHASDLHLDTTYRRLEYSEDGTTWREIKLPGSGAHSLGTDWTLPPGISPKVMLRVTMRDQAGNEHTAVTTSPMNIDLVVPEGKVTGIRPQGIVPEQGPMPRMLDGARNRAVTGLDHFFRF